MGWGVYLIVGSDAKEVRRMAGRKRGSIIPSGI